MKGSIMIEDTIERIKKKLPEVEHIVMFYNDGTVFRTTFEEINIPKLGENISAILANMRRMYEICNYELGEYNSIVFDTNNVNVIILKLGENSNLSLFFRKIRRKGKLRLKTIRQYLEKVEDLLDIDQDELAIQELESKEDQLDELKLQMGSQQYKLITLREYQNEIVEEEKKKEVSKEIEKVNKEILIIKGEIDKKITEISSLKDEIAAIDS
jgi:predicted regulator of Ras-like GTPase activity (Roadblock/LC7/MglB family)